MVIASAAPDLIVAFISGIASILGGLIAIKAAVKHEDAQCEKRLAAFREGLERADKK